MSVVYPSFGLLFLHFDHESDRRGACRALNRMNADLFKDLGDKLDPGRPHSHAHPGRSGRRARARRRHLGLQSRRPRRVRAATGRVGGPPGCRARPVGPVVRHLRHGQPLRLRPGVGGLPAARRLPELPLGRAGLAEPPLGLELRLQPRGDARREQPRAWPSRSSWAGSPGASPTSTLPSWKAAWPGRPACWPTSSATGRSATGPNMVSLDPYPHRPRGDDPGSSPTTATP